ncbi:MAG: transcription antiterminator [Spirochaetaceae bacterium]|nr:transcription antiterminator [Spirochaetaceae bacterium]
MPVSSRLTRILELLLQKNEPVRAGELAEELGSSRRTLFRDLKNAEALLAPRGLALVSVPGKGLELRGEAGELENFASTLRLERSSLPGNRQERLLGLLIELLDDNDVHKLFYFAYTLGTSEATVSKDLDALESWLGERGITLIRRPGLGVSYSGGEAAVRAALFSRIVQEGRMGNLPYLEALGYPPADIKSGVSGLFNGQFERTLDWMTPDSKELLELFLVIGIERIEKGRHLAEAEQPEGGAYLYRLADFIAQKIEERFSVNLPQAERMAIAAQLKTCRAMLHNPFNPAETRDYAYIMRLVHEMIDRFDPEIAPSLKLNEHLLNGLSLHLWAALDRLEKQIDLPDPLHGEVAAKYPELFRKSLRALAVLEERLGHPVPESEASLIAMHFYAVLFNLEARNTRKRMLRVCILCAGGIGVSYMLASQIRQRYKDELEIDLSDYTSDSFDDYDFLISLIPPDKTFICDRPVLVVNSFLTDDDHKEIRRAIDRYAFVRRGEPGAAARAPLAERIECTAALLESAKNLLEGFRRIDVDSDCSFEELVKTASGIAGKGKDGAALIEKALLEREAISSQVLDRLSLVLLHARSAGVKAPALALLVPARRDGGDNAAFTRSYFRGAKSCVLMLLPETRRTAFSGRGRPIEAAPRDACALGGGMTEIMGIISGALIEEKDFLEAVWRGDIERVRAMLETDISEYLVQFCRETLKN